MPTLPPCAHACTPMPCLCPPQIAAYVDRVRALPGVKAWIDDALAEKDFLDFEEPYRLQPTQD